MKIINKTSYEIPFELNHLYEFYMNSEYAEMPEATIRKVIKAVLTVVATETSRAFIQFKLASFYNDIEWQWMTNRGSLSKRIGKWLKDHHDIKMNESLATAIGNIVRESIVKEQTYYFDIVKEFKWKAGEFADADSCFWMDGRKQVLPALEQDARIYAIRFFKKRPQTAVQKYSGPGVYYPNDNHYYQGIGRAWFATESIQRKGYNDSLVYVVFNGYGLTTSQITSVFASYLSLASNRIGILNQNAYDDDLYTNEGGYMVGDQSIVSQVKNYDFAIRTRSYHGKKNPTLDIHGKLDDIQKQYDAPGIWSLKVGMRETENYLRDLSTKTGRKKDAGSSPFNAYFDLQRPIGVSIRTWTEAATGIRGAAN